MITDHNSGHLLFPGRVKYFRFGSPGPNPGTHRLVRGAGNTAMYYINFLKKFKISLFFFWIYEYLLYIHYTKIVLILKSIV